MILELYSADIFSLNNNTTKVSSNFLVPHAFGCRVLVSFTSHVFFFGKDEQANAVSEGCSKMFYKIIWKTLVMEISLGKIDLQPKTV